MAEGKLRDRRGASLTSYGLVVGLISIVALAAVTGIGSNITELFGETGTALDEVINPAEGAAATPETPPTVTDLDVSDINNQPTSIQVVSEIIQPTVTAPTTLTVSGDGSPEVRICSDSACSSVTQAYATSVPLASGDYLQVRITTPSTTLSTHTVTLSAGGANTSFSVVTGDGDCFGASSCMFHTSNAYNGNLGGLSGADSICTNDPNNPGGPAYAVLATNGYNHDRGMTLKLPIRRSSDNAIIADDAPQFFCHNGTGSQCEAWTNGLASASSNRVWTGVVYLYSAGSTWSGAPASANCNGWTSSSNSYIGNMGSRSSDSAVGKPTVWMEGNHPPGCSTQYRFTCVSNVQTPPN